MDHEKITGLRDYLEEYNLDALIVRNPENVLYVSGYWPITGWSLAIVNRDGELSLIVPESELEYVDNSIKDIKVLPGESLDDVWQPYKLIKEKLREIDLGEKPRIGVEMSFETMATNNVVGELNYASLPSFNLFKEVWNAELIDATDILYELRKVKTEKEIEKMKIANEIAAKGLEAGREKLKEDMTEAELASIIEHVIHSEGIGYKGVKRARGFAFVMSGVNGSKAYYPYNISSDKKIKRGETILIELNVYADGYWTDITRTWCIGSPKQMYQDIRDILIAAQEEVYRNFKEGMSAKEVDALARNFIRNTKYAKLFPHRLGHGIGVRIHEPPALHPASVEKMKVNVTHTVEPGMYGKDFGIRYEDVVRDQKKGVEVLTKIDKDL
ncbi:MAG: aminopeptidase P family protein [Thermoproteales archaeon]|nr:aminopeptidase P family protein [Thermoproteales archaeon]